MANSSPINDDTPSYPKVKFSFQLQGMLASALGDACRKRNETPKQLVTDILEAFLVKEGYLPDWWFNGDRHVK